MTTQRLQTPLFHWLRRGVRGVLVALTVCVAACGGGGGSGSDSGSSNSGSSSSGSATSSLPAAPSQQPIAATASNTVPVAVNGGIGGVVNIPTVSVTVCVSGTTNCTTVNNVQVDTASFGLRLVASALPAPFLNALPVNTAANGGQLAECTAFADGYTWGTVRNVDVKLGGETASDIPIQVIGDLAASTVPQACANIGAAQTSSSDLGANGILGIGVAPRDCGANCAQSAATSNYYSCPGGANCTTTALATNAQVANPVANFPVDNNGVIVEMAPVSYDGAASATGTLVFGIGTESNNTMGASQTFQTTSWGDLSTTFNSRSLTAFLDTGSNALFFNDSALPQCGGALTTFYCPSTPQTFTVTLTGANGSSGNASFSVVSASTLMGSNGNNGNFAFNDLAGQFGSGGNFDLGLPFFYGRYVYYGQDMTASGGQAPFVAF